MEMREELLEIIRNKYPSESWQDYPFPEDITDAIMPLIEQLHTENKRLEKALESAIMPKFNMGVEKWVIDENNKPLKGVINGIKLTRLDTDIRDGKIVYRNIISYRINTCIGWFNEKGLFETELAAEADKKGE